MCVVVCFLPAIYIKDGFIYHIQLCSGPTRPCRGWIISTTRCASEISGLENQPSSYEFLQLIWLVVWNSVAILAQAAGSTPPSRCSGAGQTLRGLVI